METQLIIKKNGQLKYHVMWRNIIIAKCMMRVDAETLIKKLNEEYTKKG